MSATSQDQARIPLEAAAEPTRKANFFIVGAPKCGTTAWFEYLRSHPDIYFPDLKEPCFFALDFPSLRQVRSEEEYSRLFSEKGAAKIVGEASAVYLFSETAANQIRDYNRTARILILLRDQEEYLPSVHNQHLWEFWDDIQDFESAWQLSGHRSQGTVSAACTEPRMLDYRAMGRFCEQVERYLDAFPPEQILVVRYRDWVADPRAAYRKILDFLELQDDGRIAFPRVHQGMSYRSRTLVRFMTFPPKSLRKLSRLLKRTTGLETRTLVRSVQKAIGLLSTLGYNKVLSPELREEISQYYAEDNKRLEAKLRNAGVSPHDVQASAGNVEAPARQLIS
jgi:hypothetical protein